MGILAKINLSPVNFLDVQKEILENLVAEMKKSRTMLKDFERVKDEIEDRLYETFLPILNAKKRKIGELEEELGGSASGRTSTAAEDYGSETEEENCDGEGNNVNDDGTGCKATNPGTDDSLDLLNESL